MWRTAIYFIPIELLAGAVILSITISFMDRVGIKSSILWYGTQLLVLILVGRYVAFPIAKRCAESNIQSIQRHERITKETIEECLIEFLDDNDIYMSKKKIREITEYVYDNRLYVDSDEVGFWIKDRFLRELKTIAGLPDS